MYRNNPTNISNTILQIVSNYILCNKHIGETTIIRKCNVPINSLEVIYVSIYTELSSGNYYLDNKLNDCGQMLYMFLLDVINRQLKHNYISTDEYNKRKNELTAVYH